MSSNSEDECYGNTTKKFQNLLHRYKEDKIDTRTLLKDSPVPKTTVSSSSTIMSSVSNVETSKVDPETIVISSKDDSLYEDDVILDQIIALNSFKQTRSKTKRGSRGNVRGSRSSRKRGRGRASNNVLNESDIGTSILNNSIDCLSSFESSMQNLIEVLDSPIRGRRSRRSRPPRGIMAAFARSRGSPYARRRGRGVNSPRNRHSSYPTYSVGNTDEYPDLSDNVALFNSKTTEAEAVDDSLDENEELSIKVYWQSTDIIKFTIRRFQKIKQIFDFFVNRENVAINKILLTYNDKILKPEDTPDGIDYNIAKFIDGGIVNSVPELGEVEKTENVNNGLKIKFQCQNLKKPLTISIQREEKFNQAMIKCAEHLDIPLTSLKFEFDGDCISGSMTPEDLELEGGECIDVKILK